MHALHGKIGELTIDLSISLLFNSSGSDSEAGFPTY